MGKLGHSLTFLQETYLPTDVPSIQRRVVDHVEYTLARDRSNFDSVGAYQVLLWHVTDLSGYSVFRARPTHRVLQRHQVQNAERESQAHLLLVYRVPAWPQPASMLCDCTRV